jgi:hypothetical protein
MKWEMLSGKLKCLQDVSLIALRIGAAKYT